MRTILCTNGLLGARVARWLAERDELIGVVLHEPDRRRDVDGIEDLGVPTWSWPATAAAAAALEPDCLLSVLFGHRLDAAWLRLPSWAAVNLHPGLLPFNAGANPNVWPLVDGTPAGTTLHLMTEAIDAGDILAQREVPVSPADTGATLYERLQDASWELFVETWPTIADATPTPQGPDGSYHRVADRASLHPGLDDLAVIDRLRALTFAPYGAEFERDGRRWRLRVEIEAIEEIEEIEEPGPSR
ncbi:MAG: formyl transferase domain protein [Acidimicrobiales bacterium]|nr:formyl transferase domain protein [Acidimicrobiales bacterium]